MEQKLRADLRRGLRHATDAVAEIVFHRLVDIFVRESIQTQNAVCSGKTKYVALHSGVYAA